MKYILSQIIFIGFVLAVYFAVEVVRKREWKYRENKIFVLLCFFSAIWSFGFFGVIMQSKPDRSYLWRAIGMVGTFGFLITAQYLISHLSGIKRSYCRFTESFSLLGILLFPFVIQKEQATYELSNIGMTYSFQPTIWNNLYIWYTIIVAVNQSMVIIYMIRNSKIQRMRALGKRLIIVELVIVKGMLLDTIFPLFGQPAIPGSTIGQFIGLAVMYSSISFVHHSRITISNMSEFIYYSLNVPVLVFDSREELQILNDTAFSFLGVERDRMEEVSIEMLFTVTKEEAFQFADNSRSIDTVCRHNEKYCNLAVNKIHDAYGDKIGYIIIVTDLSERMKSMMQLEEAMKEAENANRAKSVFLANMSHEIRTPMNAIVGFSELLLKKNISPEVREHVQDIKWSSHNLLAIINDILDISKLESGRMELILDDYYTADMLADVVMIIAPQAEKAGLKFDIKADRTIPKELRGDKVRIRGILINILNNAVKYTTKGSITFDISIVQRDEKQITMAFRVKDTGTGIKQENISSLFDNFERFDQKVHYGVEGTGLGLSIAKNYVTLMGGDITVSSEYGKGSVFTVELTQEIVDNRPMEREDIHGKDVMGSGSIFGFTAQNVRVLVVDDNPINLKVCHGILSTYGIEVDTALSGREAVELCEKQNYNMVFMDQMMPELDGIETMQQIRQLNQHYAPQGAGKIIVLTANAIKGTREALMQLGFDEYLAKPMNVERLEGLLCKFIPKDDIVFASPEEIADSVAMREDIKYIQEKMPQVDVELGIYHCGGELRDYLKVLEITYEYGEKQVNELNRLWETKEYRTYHIKVHALKSTSLNIGAKDISREAKRQEQAGQNGDYGYIEENREKLIASYVELLEQIREVLLHFDLISEMPEEETEKLQLAEKEILQLFQEIEKQIDDFDFAKVFDILEETKRYQMPRQYADIFAQIEKLMDDFSVEEVKELLKEYSHAN